MLCYFLNQIDVCVRVKPQRITFVFSYETLGFVKYIT